MRSGFTANIKSTFGKHLCSRTKTVFSEVSFVHHKCVSKILVKQRLTSTCLMFLHCPFIIYVPDPFTGLERKYTCYYVSIGIVDESFCFSITLMVVCVILQVYLYFGHRQLGKRVLFILVFHIKQPWARLGVIFSGLNRFFHP